MLVSGERDDGQCGGGDEREQLYERGVYSAG